VLLLLASTAWANCFYDELDTRVEAADGGFVRRDRWSIYVETGRAECAALAFEDDGATVTDLRIRIRHPDERTRRPDAAERWEELAPDGRELRPGAVLHLPELRFGDTLELEIERRYDGGWVWRPAVWGPVGIARLTHTGPAPELRLEPEMLEPASGSEWTFTDVRSTELAATFGTPAVRVATAPATGPTIEREWTIGADLSRRVVELRSAHMLPGTHLAIGVPESARDVRCMPVTLGPAPSEVEPVLLGRGCAFIADREADVSLRAEWSLPDPAIGGEVSLRELVPIESSTLEVRETSGAVALVASGEVRVLGSGAHGQAQARGLAAATSEGVMDPVVSWRIVRHGSTDVLAAREAALAFVARRAVAASIPEPGLPVGMRYARADDAAIATILAHVREQVRPGVLPGTSAVEPRKLLQVRRSGWASPWEMALLLTRYLRQVRVDAVPMMVRARRHGPADPLDPWSYADGAVVRVREGERELWIDPSCPQCAVGEIGPELWGGDVLHESLTTLPAAPRSTRERHYTFGPDGEGSLRATFTGPAAVRLRLALADVRLRDRPAWLATHFGGTTLTSIDGIEPGGSLTLEVGGIRVADLAELRPARWTIQPDGEPRVRLPIEGTETVIVRGATGGHALHVERAGLIYDRIVTPDGVEERIEVADPVVTRADALAFLAAIDAP
jgi:hypothetical protein